MFFHPWLHGASCMASLVPGPGVFCQLVEVYCWDDGRVSMKFEFLLQSGGWVSFWAETRTQTFDVQFSSAQRAGPTHEAAEATSRGALPGDSASSSRSRSRERSGPRSGPTPRGSRSGRGGRG